MNREDKQEEPKEIRKGCYRNQGKTFKDGGLQSIEFSMSFSKKKGGVTPFNYTRRSEQFLKVKVRLQWMGGEKMETCTNDSLEKTDGFWKAARDQGIHFFRLKYFYYGKFQTCTKVEYNPPSPIYPSSFNNDQSSQTHLTIHEITLKQWDGILG